MERNEVRELAAQYAQNVTELEEMEFPTEDFEDMVDALVGSVLDVDRTFSSSGDLKSVRLTMAWGGPNVFWTVDDHHFVVVTAAWYSEPESVTVEAPLVAGLVWELFDNWSVSV